MAAWAEAAAAAWAGAASWPAAASVRAGRRAPPGHPLHRRWEGSVHHGEMAAGRARQHKQTKDAEGGLITGSCRQHEYRKQRKERQATTGPHGAVVALAGLLDCGKEENRQGWKGRQE